VLRKIARRAAIPVVVVFTVFAARYALVPAAILALSGALTAVIVRVLLRYFTVLELPRRLQRPRDTQDQAVTGTSPASITAAPARLALPAPRAPVSAQRPRTGTRDAGHGA
jgi:hypothetical protein